MLGRGILATALTLGMLGVAHADDVVKIGVLNDQSGIAADLAGPGSVAAVRMAVEDFGSIDGKTIEVVFADHQNKPEIASQIASAWYDRDGVDMIMDLPNASTALAVSPCDFSKIAEGFGVRGVRVEDAGHLPDALNEAMKLSEPVVVDVVTDFASAAPSGWRKTPLR